MIAWAMRGGFSQQFNCFSTRKKVEKREEA
jgi:hypothetical protein